MFKTVQTLLKQFGVQKVEPRQSSGAPLTRGLPHGALSKKCNTEVEFVES